jgi:hypothetical protein
MDYFGARYLSAGWGRFVSADAKISSGKTYNPQSWNRYGYALSNPLAYIDTSGEEALPAKVQQLITSFAPTAFRAVGQAAKAFDLTRTILSNARSIGLVQPVVIGGPQASEAERIQARQVSRMTGNDVLLVDNPRNKAFDSLQFVGGFINPSDAIPTELKGLTTSA